MNSTPIYLMIMVIITITMMHGYVHVNTEAYQRRLAQPIVRPYHVDSTTPYAVR